MLKHAGTYEIMTPESVGLMRSTLVMGKHSGRHAFKTKLKELGFELGENALEDAFRRFKDLADKKKEIFDEDIVALIDDAVVRSQRAYPLHLAAGHRRLERAAEGGPGAGDRRRTESDHGDGRRPCRRHLQGDQADLPARRALAALPGSCGDRGHRCTGGSDGAAGRERQDGKRPGVRYRYSRGVVQGLFACAEQASNQKAENGTGGNVGVTQGIFIKHQQRDQHGGRTRRGPHYCE